MISKERYAKFVIFTVFRPEENGPYLEEWMDYHRSIGCTHFYLYGNYNGYGNRGEILYNFAGQEKSKSGHDYKWSTEESEYQMEKICQKNNDITFTKWQPVYGGKVGYGWCSAYKDFLNKAADKDILAAIIDIDEFIVLKDVLKPGRMHQVVFKDIQNYKSVYDCKEKRKQNISISNLETKCIMHLKNPYPIIPQANDDHTVGDITPFPHFWHVENIPDIDTVYYHYNWSERRHYHMASWYGVPDTPYEYAFEYHPGLNNEII